RAMRSFSSTASLKVSATLPATPVHSTGRRTEKSPFFKAVRAVSKTVVSSPVPTDSWRTSIGSSPLQIKRTRGLRELWHTRPGLDRNDSTPHLTEAGDQSRQYGWEFDSLWYKVPRVVVNVPPEPLSRDGKEEKLALVLLTAKSLRELGLGE